MIDQYFQKQDVMRRLIYALIPLFFFAVLLYGWSVLMQTAVVFAGGIATEYFFTRQRGKKISEAVLVTCALYALALPPALPLWITLVGIVFAVALAKEAYGGFGRNIFNPAIAGRLFIFLSFPVPYNAGWIVPASRGPQGFSGLFGTAQAAGVDTVTAATPLALLRTGEIPPLMDLFLGFRGGSSGESSVILILLAALFLVATKTANWKTMVSTFLGALTAAGAFFFGGLIPGLSPASFPGFSAMVPLAAYMMSGSILFVTVFMATDPITAPNKPLAQFIYGLMIGGVSMTVRTLAGFPEGTSFGILVANTFSPFLDEHLPAPKKKTRKIHPAGAAR
ncbi:RnfABCDGE type electron transport complex subunit D [Alkalispirochaeta alkalica]|uniref:RnfABCDGE type electron transport complex subunit D n=1 Tax=Alkalispirochaeta alkalica TaxID=46356 RepID=UPI000371C5C2|nr:RnfABCDGE type electron transport complex subunit D [Alkalispirochaeta alkalica]